jgi:homocitrate synthase NifV
VGRTEPEFLKEYAVAVSEAGADRLRLSDTIGILGPNTYAATVRSVGEVTNLDTQCHCHNDFGLAVANTLAGVEAGATYFHVCVNGMGERAGMPDLATTVMCLYHFYGKNLGIKLDGLTALSSLVAKHCAKPLMPWYPVVGRNVFAHESGIHSKGMINDEKTFEPFLPEVVGGERRIVIGKHSGKAGIKYVLEQCGEVVDPDLLEQCLKEVRQEAVRCGSEVRPSKLVSIYRSLAQRNSEKGLNLLGAEAIDE